jgi:CubicO group peptidase (beta-lactamase class C family)
MEGDWNVFTPDAAGIDAKPLGALVEWLDRFQSANIHSVLVVRGGALCFERYRRGSDQCWDQPRPNFIHSSSTKHDLKSITKSVTALLVGIAIDQRYIAGVDEPLFRYFSDYALLTRTA